MVFYDGWVSDTVEFFKNAAKFKEFIDNLGKEMINPKNLFELFGKRSCTSVPEPLLLLIRMRPPCS